MSLKDLVDSLKLNHVNVLNKFELQIINIKNQF